MKILSINIRGFKVEGKVDWFRKMIASANPIIAAIQETKFHKTSDRWIEFLWGFPDVGYVEKRARGRSGGLLLIWDSNSFRVDQAVEGDYFIAVKGKLVGHDTDIVVVNVYGPHKEDKKKCFWDSLSNLLMFDNVAWVLCGDFNEVWRCDERKNCIFLECRASMFNEFIENNGLIEIPLVGRRFTRISDDGVKFSKLDRFLVSEKFALMWNDLLVIPLDRKLTDHSPILLKNGIEDFGPKPTRVFDVWLEEEGAESVIAEAWNSNVNARNPDTIFRLKLKNVKERLKQWSKEKFGSIDTEILELIDESRSWELEAENRSLTDAERNEWMSIRNKWLVKERDKRTMLKQKA
ncbi:uncharacterized protein [Rutidosis leptorrhynchoides]|uniref:uncharacterized protein n=1 Tax=Rutidosis leptorrhynchoides TaxID=125765 RepID=UPI003A990C5D